MTGVIEGSGGTGLREGSRPGSGSVGADTGPPTPLLIGTAESSYTTSFNTASFTALPERAMYIAAVVTGGSGTLPNVAATVTGMGLEWNLWTQRIYRSSGSNEGRLDTFFAYGEATDGALTIASSQGLGRAVLVLAVEEGNFPLNLTEAPLYVNPAVTPTPPVEEWETVVAIHGLAEMGGTSTTDPAFTAIGESPAQAQGLKVFADFHKPTDLPDDYSFDNAAGVANGVDVVMFTMAALPVRPYANTLNGYSPTINYPLRVKSTLPDIDGYDTELQKAQYDLDVWYPLAEKGTLPGGDIPGYDALITTELDPSFYVHPGAKGAGSDPGDYDTLVTTTMDPSFFVHPGAKGAGSDPGTYDTEITGKTPARFFPGDTLDPAAALPTYDTVIAGLTPSRYYDDRLVELPPAILALNPVGYWQLNGSTTTAVDASGNSNDGTFSGDYTLQDEPGPDGFSYAHFRSDFIAPGHGARVTVPTTALDGSFSPFNHGATWVMLIKRDTPADLGYPIAKRTGSSSDREYDMSYSGTNWRVSAFDDTNAEIMQTVASNPNTTAWELIVYRCPDISFGGADPFEIFADSAVPLTPSIAESAGINYTATNSPLGIGGFPDTDAYGHNGAMAHVAVFDYEMSDAQIDTLIAAAVADGWIDPPPPTLARRGTSVADNDADNTTHTPNMPTHAAGDLLICQATITSSGSIDNVTAEWTVQIDTESVSKLATIWKIAASGSETLSFDRDGGPSTIQSVVQVWKYAGAPSLGAVQGWNESVTDTVINIPSVAGVVAGEVALALVGSNDDNNIGLATGDYTDLFTEDQSGVGTGSCLAAAEARTPGTIAAATFTAQANATTADRGVVRVIIIPPA